MEPYLHSSHEDNSDKAKQLSERGFHRAVASTSSDIADDIDKSVEGKKCCSAYYYYYFFYYSDRESGSPRRADQNF